MTPEEMLPDLLSREAVAPRRFDPRTATPFVNKSVSEETRRAYHRAVSDFFQFVGGKHPVEVVPHDVLRWRDHLRAGRKRPATVSFKLSVVRSFFEYLKAGGAEAYLFQPHSNYRTLTFDKGLSPRMVQKVVRKWGSFTGVGDVSPHDLRHSVHNVKRLS